MRLIDSSSTLSFFEEDYKPKQLSFNDSNDLGDFHQTPILSLKDAEFFQTSCICERQNDNPACILCNTKKRLTISDLTAILTHFYSPKSEEFDTTWTMNAFAHIVWKLNSHQYLHPSHDLLSLETIVYHLSKRYKREFIDGKRSFL